MKPEHIKQVADLREAGHTIKEIAEQLGRSTTWVSLASDPEAYARHQERSRNYYRQNSATVLAKRKADRKGGAE